MKIYSISDKYIGFLRNDKRLYNVYDNKENERKHTRKYIGFVFEINEFKYFVPLSSPKDTDYIKTGNKRYIRRNVPTIWRIIDKKGLLIGTIRFCGMVPVPDSELELYNLHSEKDSAYKDLIINQMGFITKNQGAIIKNAKFLYQQKCNEEVLLSKGIQSPSYLAGAVDYKYAEQKCLEYNRLTI